MPNYNSLKAHERIIFPLDFPDFDKANKYVRLLRDHIGVFKIGLELFVSEGPKVIHSIKEETDAKIFLDLKFHDIPETVKRAQKSVGSLGADFITVHCSDGAKLLEAAVEGAGSNTKVLGVTVLTSLSKEDLSETGIKEELQDPLKLALHRANIAKQSGCAGIVCSGKEVKAVREKFGKDFLTIVPGVRPLWSMVSNDDQSRITTPVEAVTNGADYIVVGRPIRDAQDPVEAAKKIVDEIRNGAR